VQEYFERERVAMSQEPENQLTIAATHFAQYPMPQDATFRQDAIGTLLQRWVIGKRWNADDFYEAIQLGFELSQLDPDLAREEVKRAWKERFTEFPTLRPPKLIAVTGDKIKKIRLRWLLQDLIPVGSVTFLAGDPDTGKSTLVSMWAAQVTTGKLPGTYFGTPIDVIWVDGEESLSTYTLERMESYGVDLSRLHIVRKAHWSNPERETKVHFPLGLERLGELVEQYNAKMIIFDPLTRHLSSGYKENDQQDTRAAMDSLIGFCEERDTAVLGLGHFGKDKRSGRSVMGSGAWEACARNSIWTYQDAADQRFFGLAKANNQPDRRAWQFEIVPTGVEGVAKAEIVARETKSIREISSAGDARTYRQTMEQPDEIETKADKIMASIEMHKGAALIEYVKEDCGLAERSFARVQSDLVKEGKLTIRRDPVEYKRKWLVAPEITEEQFNEICKTHRELQGLRSGS
jgi:archaellum biogenesis ATPase FlaH